MEWSDLERSTDEGNSPVVLSSWMLKSLFFLRVGLFKIAALIPVVDPIES